MDWLFADFTVETALRQVLVPYLGDLGDRWAKGAIGVATEHFASNLLGARLASLARGWGRDMGHAPCSPARPVSGTTCPCWPSASSCTATDGDHLPRRRHPTRRSRRHCRREASQRRDPCRPHPERFQESIPDPITLALTAPLRLACAGATTSIADTVGATNLAGDPITKHNG